MNGAAIGLIAAAMAGGTAAVYALARSAPRPSALAVVDLASLLRAHQATSARLLFETPGQLPSAAAAGTAYVQALDAAVKATSRECRCTLLVREAVVAGELPDLTATVAARIKAAEGQP